MIIQESCLKNAMIFQTGCCETMTECLKLKKKERKKERKKAISNFIAKTSEAWLFIKCLMHINNVLKNVGATQDFEKAFTYEGIFLKVIEHQGDRHSEIS